MYNKEKEFRSTGIQTCIINTSWSCIKSYTTWATLYYLPSPGKAGHTTGVYVPQLFPTSGGGSFTSHKNQINESALRRDLQFFVLIREE